MWREKEERGGRDGGREGDRGWGEEAVKREECVSVCVCVCVSVCVCV